MCQITKPIAEITFREWYEICNHYFTLMGRKCGTCPLKKYTGGNCSISASLELYKAWDDTITLPVREDPQAG